MLFMHPLKPVKGRCGLFALQSLARVSPNINGRRLVARSSTTKAQSPTAANGLSRNATHGPAEKRTPPIKTTSFAESVLIRFGPVEASLRRVEASRPEKNKRIFDEIFGPPSIDEREIAAELEKNPDSAVSMLRRLINSGGATARVVHMCVLQRWSTFSSMNRRGRHSLRSELLDQQFSRVVLRYILSDINLWIPLVYAGYAMWLPICYFAIIEGNESIIRDWLAVDVSALEDKPHGHKWRGRMLGSLVEAHAHLDTDHCANSMLQCLMDVAAQKEAALRKGYQQSILSLDLTTAITTATIKLTKESESWHNTDAAIYDRFVRLHDKFLNTAGFKFSAAKLQLCHPKTPEEKEAMIIAEEYLTKGLGDAIAEVANRTSRQRTADTLHGFFNRAAKVAEDNGNAKGAALIRNEVLRKVVRDFGSHNLQHKGDPSSSESKRLPPSRVPVPQFQ